MLPHLTGRKLPDKKGRVDITCRSHLERLSVYSEVQVKQDKTKGKAKWGRPNRYLHDREGEGRMGMGRGEKGK